MFRIVGTKQNLSAPDPSDRWFRLKSVEMGNAQPPIYPHGDKVAVVESFKPGASGAAFSRQLVNAALSVISSAKTPLSPSKSSGHRYAVPFIAQTIAPHRGNRACEVEAAAILKHVIATGLVVVEQIKISRGGGRADARAGLVLTAAGMIAIEGGAE
jgi:hypothetical protein